MNLASRLARSGRLYADRLALRMGSEARIYRELDDESTRLAGLLLHGGLRSGDRVGIMLANVPEFAVVYYGILRAGGVVVPMNPMLKAREVAYHLGDSGAGLIFVAAGSVAEAGGGATQVGAEVICVDTGFADLLNASPAVTDVVDRDGSDTAVILFTSGTSGQPKGAELTHHNLISNADSVVSTLLHLSKEDVVFGGLPLFHSFGQTCALNAAVAAGACVTLLPRFEPTKALQLAELPAAGTATPSHLRGHRTVPSPVTRQTNPAVCCTPVPPPPASTSRQLKEPNHV